VLPAGAGRAIVCVGPPAPFNNREYREEESDASHTMQGLGLLCMSD